MSEGLRYHELVRLSQAALEMSICVGPAAVDVDAGFAQSRVHDIETFQTRIYLI